MLDKERLKNGSFLNENYFDELLQEIREIRISERNFYQKITDIYSTSLDYNSESPLTQEFFKTVQNKMHYATHGNTADQAERHIPMTMEDWKKLDVFLQFNGREVLDNPGKVSHKIAESIALSEFEKYRVIQDKIFESDFDKFLLDMKNENLDN